MMLFGVCFLRSGCHSKLKIGFKPFMRHLAASVKLGFQYIRLVNCFLYKNTFLDVIGKTEPVKESSPDSRLKWGSE